MIDHAHLEVNSEYVVFVDSKRRYVDCSTKACGLLGYSRAEMLQMSIDDVSYTGEVQKLFELYLQQGRMEGEYVLRHKDGSPVAIHYRSFVFPDGCNAAFWEPRNDWKQLYFAALLEIDSTKLNHRVDIALAAVNNERAKSKGRETSAADEQQLVDALAALKQLQRR